MSLNNFEHYLCTYIAAKIDKIVIFKMNRKYSIKLGNAKRTKHKNCRGSNRHRDGKAEKGVKELSRINKRIRMILTYHDAISKNSHLLDDIKDVNIPKKVVLDWLELNIKDAEITRIYLTGKAC